MRPALVLGTAVFIVLALVFAVVFPFANAGVVGGGSDRDEALDIAARRIAAGEYPYSEPTYLGNPISPMPGAVLIAAPFAILATSALQNLLWLPLAAAALGTLTKPPLAAVAWAITLVVLVPAVLNEFLTGSDLLTNSLYVGAFTLLLLRSASLENGTLHPALWAILLGVALSSRAHLLLLLAPLARALFLLRGSRGLALVGLVLLAFAGVTLPFVLGHLSDFTPLHTAAKLVFRGTLFPGQAEAVLLASAAAACLLALRLRTPGIAATLRASSWAVATPVLLTALGASAATEKPQFVILTFILPATVLATMARWTDWFGQPATTE